MSVNYSVGVPVLAVNIVNGGDVYGYKVGDTLKEATIRRPYTTEVVTGEILAMRLFDKADVEGNENIIDGIEAGKYERKYAEMKTVEEEFAVDALLLNVLLEDGETYANRVIKVADIMTIGEYENEDGTVIRTLTAEDGKYDLAGAMAEVPEGSTLKMSEGEVDTELTVDKGLVIRGANAGVPQN